MDILTIILIFASLAFIIFTLYKLIRLVLVSKQEGFFGNKA